MQLIVSGIIGQSEFVLRHAGMESGQTPGYREFQPYSGVPNAMDVLLLVKAVTFKRVQVGKFRLLLFAQLRYFQLYISLF